MTGGGDQAQYGNSAQIVGGQYMGQQPMGMMSGSGPSGQNMMPLYQQPLNGSNGNGGNNA